MCCQNQKNCKQVVVLKELEIVNDQEILTSIDAIAGNLKKACEILGI